MTQLFCDLDGVLVDFEGGFLRNFGFAHNSVSEPEMWKYIMSHERHWHDMPMMHDGMVLWDFIKDKNPIILTGCPATGYDLADAGKREWCAKMLGPEVPVYTCRSKDKPKFMTAKGDILIDDLTKNQKRWEAEDGLFVLHRTAEDSIKQLKTIYEMLDA